MPSVGGVSVALGVSDTVCVMVGAKVGLVTTIRAYSATPSIYIFLPSDDWSSQLLRQDPAESGAIIGSEISVIAPGLTALVSAYRDGAPNWFPSIKTSA